MENESAVVQEVDRCVKCGDSKGVDANGLCLSDNCLKVACRCVFPSTSAPIPVDSILVPIEPEQDIYDAVAEYRKKHEVSEVEDKTSSEAGKEHRASPSAECEIIPQLNASPAFTSGPWFWRVDLNARQVTLQSEGNMRQIVMDFTRWGNGGGPRFYKDGLMERADSFATIVEGREHHRAWFQFLNHPDAHLIAAAPALYEALKHLLNRVSELGDEGRAVSLPLWNALCIEHTMEKARAALALARGEVTADKGALIAVHGNPITQAGASASAPAAKQGVRTR